MNGETDYLRILKHIVDNGERKSNRTGIDTFAIPPQTITHDMSEGFPLLTTKNVAFKPIRVELEFFIKGLTDKAWLKERGCNIWNEWASPWAVEKYMEETGETDVKKAQLEVDDLGPVYGAQWRDFNYGAVEDSSVVGDGSQDQLRTIVASLHNNPNDRRMVCSAWNPLQISAQALPPCHLLWNVMHINGKLHLHWHQRSADFFLGVPFNLASYSLLLHLLCLEANMEPGQVTGTFVDCHIYENHLEAIETQLSRTSTDLPTIKTEGFNSIFTWDNTMTKSVGYNHQGSIKAEVAV